MRSLIKRGRKTIDEKKYATDAKNLMHAHWRVTVLEAAAPLAEAITLNMATLFYLLLAWRVPSDMLIIYGTIFAICALRVNRKLNDVSVRYKVLKLHSD